MKYIADHVVTHRGNKHSPLLRTPPEARILMTSTPYLTWARMVWRICSGPSARLPSPARRRHTQSW
jgi:hypothetical protein